MVSLPEGNEGGRAVELRCDAVHECLSARTCAKRDTPPSSLTCGRRATTICGFFSGPLAVRIKLELHLQRPQKQTGPTAGCRRARCFAHPAACVCAQRLRFTDNPV